MSFHEVKRVLGKAARVCLLACSFLPSFLPSCQSCALALLLPCCCRRDKQARNSESRCPMTSSLALSLSSPVNFLSLALPCSFCLCVRSFCVYLSLFHCLLHSHTHSHTYYLLAFSFSLSFAIRSSFAFLSFVIIILSCCLSVCCRILS